MSAMKLYAPAFVLGVWAGVRFAALGSELLAGVFLTLTALSVIVAERERQRLVRKNRDGYRRRSDD